MNKTNENSSSTGVSFVLCCYNSEALVADTINALNNQINNGIPFEVILVDNNCTDYTVSVAESVWARSDAKLHVVKEKTPGLSFARKRGVRETKYSIISFVDDDNIVEPEWVKKVFYLFENKPDVGAVGSYNLPLIETKEPAWFEQYMHNYACGKLYPASGIVSGNKKKHLWGAGLSIRSKIIKKIYSADLPLYLTGRKGNLILAGDDSEICFYCCLLGWDLWYEHDLTLHHKIQPSRLTWNYLCKMHEGFGYCSPILEIYKRLIDNQFSLSFSALFFNKLMTFCYIVMRYNVRLMVNREGQHFQVLFYSAWGSLKGTFGLRKSYGRMVKQIRQFFSTQR
ncbi:MAG: glycosyltransferase family 2 protein [Desulfobacteraceae bacterium]|nr:glycosyltransferase family 2 protein [Desulfobacteraceae bacterium]MBC2756761.1 glycosyltransferase family 2 protein [Desulfobacteraceae bacterium]